MILLQAPEVFTLKWGDFSVILITSGFLSGIIGKIFETRLQRYHDQKLEKFKSILDLRLKQKEQSEKIAEFFAYYKSGKAEIVKLNEMAFQLSLWLPTEVLKILKDAINNTNNLTIEDILIKVRCQILEDSQDTLSADDIIHF